MPSRFSLSRNSVMNPCCVSIGIKRNRRGFQWNAHSRNTRMETNIGERDGVVAKEVGGGGLLTHEGKDVKEGK